MKVKIFYQTIAEKVIEIDDEFEVLRGDPKDIPQEVYDEATNAITRATGMPCVWECEDTDLYDTYVLGVEDVLTGETIMEG